MIIIHAIIRIKTSPPDAIIDACVEHADAGQRESGCFEYLFSLDPKTPGTIHCFERWDSDEAIQAHMHTPRSTAFAAWMDEQAERVEVNRYEVVDLQSDEFRRQSAALMGDSVQR